MKTVIELALEVGFTSGEIAWHVERIEAFAALVRADEREACALVCDEIRGTDMKPAWDTAASHCADAIRGRGETK